MADEKEKALEKAQEIQPRTPTVADELSEQDAEKVAGGHSVIAPRDPQTGQ